MSTYDRSDLIVGTGYTKENTMSIEKETILVESVTQYGVRSNGKSYNLSPVLKKKGVLPTAFEVGRTYDLELYIGSQGGRNINAFTLVDEGEAVEAPAPVVRRAAPPPPPSLPRTSLPTTKAPGGVAPVAPASKADPDKMSKEDWNVRNKSIELQAIIKSTLESPMLAQLVVGKNNKDALLTLTEVFEHSLALYESAKLR
jgi:hypothetical protein